MNRIRKVGNIYQVLLTPTYEYSPNFEIMLGNWMESNLRNFKVIEFNSLNDALGEAYKYPDIDWNKLVSIHYDAYEKIVPMITQIMHKQKRIVEIDAKLANPTEVKNLMFDRISRLGNRFTLIYNANDVISINIVNPWSQNLKDIATFLQKIPELRIVRKYYSRGIVHLIGETEMNTTYEIKLWPTLIYNWAKWVAFENISQASAKQILNQIIEKQNIIDDGIIIR